MFVRVNVLLLLHVLLLHKACPIEKMLSVNTLNIVMFKSLMK